MLFLGALLLATLTGYGCQAQHDVPLSGHIDLPSGWRSRVYVIQPQHFQEIAADYLGPVIDSADIELNGSFAFQSKHFPATKTLLILAIQKTGSRFSNHLMDETPVQANYMPIVYTPGETVDITSAGNSFQTSFHFNFLSRENKNLMALRNIRQAGFEKYSSVSGEMEDDSLLIEKEKAFSDFQQEMMLFADTTSVVEAALLAIRWVSPTNDFERIPEFIVRQCNRWQGKANENHFVEELCTKTRLDMLPPMMGDTLYDFLMPMKNGDALKLHKLLSPKLTILDLWASWCAPCRKENREVLVPLWNAYHEKGLQIIGYSLDASEAAWNAAIQKDTLTWPQSSHLTGDSTPFMEALRIRTIPANYLLDVDGKILAKNLHGEELKQFIEKKVQ